MITLAIETSCDDTGVAIVKSEGGTHEVLVNLLSSQTAIHKKFGGVVPMLAAREHEKNLPLLATKALASAKRLGIGIDAICYTAYPGLPPALFIGTTFAKTLGFALNIPVYPVNHLYGHLVSALLNNELRIMNYEFPAVGLVVSGGHTQLYLLNSFQNIKLLGQTRDDAVGEAFDKVARLLGFEYPGGPHIETLAKKGREDAVKFPSPMMRSEDYNFSYSGLKTSVLYFLQKQKTPLGAQLKADVALAFQDAALAVIIEKTKRALKEYNARTLLLGGGVSANETLKILLRNSTLGTEFFFPEKQFATDNAAMIGLAHNLGMPS